MKQIVFYGSSDDTFICYGPGIDIDHDDYANGTLRAIEVTSGNEGLVVCGQYCPPNMRKGSLCSWMIGIAMLEGKKIPDWAMKYVFHCSYSPALIMIVPEDIEVKLIIPTTEENNNE